MSTKKVEILVLAALALAMTIALVVVVLSGAADNDVKTAVVVQLASVLLLVVQAIRNVPQGEVMGKMVDHLAQSTPPKDEA